jgi:hypothetical protein
MSEIKTNIAYNKVSKQFGIIVYWNIHGNLAKIMNMGAWHQDEMKILTKEQYEMLDYYTREIDINEGWHCPSKKLIEYVFK